MNASEFDLMMKKEASALRNHALRYTKNEDDAPDLVQDTMMKAIRFYDKFEEGSNLKGWLYVIMRNTFVNNYRKTTKKNSVITLTEEISSQDLAISASSNHATGSFVMSDILKAMASIPESYSKPFILYFEGHKYHEIAERFNIPLGTVKTRIHMAREMLKKYLRTYKSL